MSPESHIQSTGRPPVSKKSRLANSEYASFFFCRLVILSGYVLQISKAFEIFALKMPLRPKKPRSQGHARCSGQWNSQGLVAGSTLGPKVLVHRNPYIFDLSNLVRVHKGEKLRALVRILQKNHWFPLR